MTNPIIPPIISNRGPIIAELVAGDGVFYVDATIQQLKEIKANGYLYIKTGESFVLDFQGKEPVNMVLFEIK